MPDPLVDVTIPVHSAARPIARAVASIVDNTEAPVRVTVVAHNIDPDVIRHNLGSYADHAGVRLLELQDGIPSPAGPMNLGIANATAPYIALLGSDDEFAPGALDAWLAIAAETGATAVIARIDVLGGRGVDPYPPVRLGRRQRALDARKDRLSYRSAPLGLVDRRFFGELRFTEGLPSGEDLAYSATLWFTGRNTAYALRGPAYIGHEDAGDRVTYVPRAVREDFAFLDAIEATPWFEDLPRRDREALAIKILRVHLFDAVAARLDSPAGMAEHSRSLNAVIGRLHEWAPGVVRLLARTDRAVIDELTSSSPDPDAIRSLLEARWNYRSIAAMLPRNPLLVMHPQAPFRTLFAGIRAKSS